MIAILSDFKDDYYSAVMKGVIKGICHRVQTIDISLASRFDVISGSWVLLSSINYFPEDVIFLVVIDPTVGTKREAIVARINNRFFVAPNNGILYSLVKTYPSEVYEIIPEKLPSFTFHGRDQFAPVAALIAKMLGLGEEIDLSNIGKKFDNLKELDICPVKHDQQGMIVYVDKFGNIISNFILEDTDNIDTIAIYHQGHPIAKLPYVNTYADLDRYHFGTLLGSSDTLEIVGYLAMASKHFEMLGVGTSIRIEINYK